MPSKNGFLDEQGMVDLVGKTIEDLRKEGVSPTELKRLENILKERGRRGVSHSVWVIKNDSKRDFTRGFTEKTVGDLPGLGRMLP